jgi:TIR domain
VVTLLTSTAQLGSHPGGPDNVIRGRFPKPVPGGWDIFISYCDRDRSYWDRIAIHLKPLNRQGVRIYAYDVLEAGTVISREAQSALLTSVVAVLLISADYLASDLVECELPDLLDQAEKRGTRILWILAGRCDLSDMNRLTKYRQVSPRASPLNRMKAPKQDDIFVELLKAIKKELAESGRYPPYRP